MAEILNFSFSPIDSKEIYAIITVWREYSLNFDTFSFARLAKCSYSVEGNKG